MKNLHSQRMRFFANRSGENPVLESFVMAKLGIVAAYSPTGSSETIYLTIESGGSMAAFLVNAGAGGIEEVELLNKNSPNYEKYKPIVEAATKEARAVALTFGSLNLSEAVIEGQLISGSHSHSVELDEDGWGESSEADGHAHWVEYGNGYTYVSSAPISIAGIQLSHSHLPVISPKVGV